VNRPDFTSCSVR